MKVELARVDHDQVLDLKGPANTPARRSRLKRVALSFSILTLGLTAGTFAALQVAKHRMGPPPIAAADALSTTVLDRQGRLLRAFTTPDGRWRLPVEPKDVDPRYLAMLKAYEDKRFERHNGVDPLAFVRAGYLLARHGRLLSGGSTLTMQVARLLEGRHERTGTGKLKQIVRALQLEEKLSKHDILRLYLRMAPFGGNIEGTRAASLAYFGKEPKLLSIGEAALLVALPQSPEKRRPDRSAKAAKKARDYVLDRAHEAGVISQAERDRAKEERIPTARREFPKFAPHLSENEVALQPTRAVHRLTVDRDAQGALENLAAEQTKLVGDKLSSAIMAVDNATGEVLAYVGSAGYLDQGRSGAIDMIQAVRSPGSTLKPLIYGLAFEAGLAHPETLIEDQPTRFGTYRPENFDEEFHGTVTMRRALGLSLNVPAVKVLSLVGPGKLAGRMQRAGVTTTLPPDTVPSLAIALGGVGMRLQDLAQLYTGLARGGDTIPLHWLKDAQPPKLAFGAREAAKRRLLTPLAAWYVTDILKDAPAPLNAKAGKLAYKTGTSYGYRDAWAVGYDGRHTIAVWVGRPDGAPTPGLMGRIAAAPILFDAFVRVAEKRTPLKAAPAGAMKQSGADLPPPLKRFGNDKDDASNRGPFLDKPILIAFPPDRSELDVDDRAGEPLVLKAEGGALPLTWLVDGTPMTTDANSREVSWTPPGRGFVKLQVVDAEGRVDRVTVRLK